MQVLKFVEMYLRKYSITLAFVDGRKVVGYSCSLYRIR